MGRDNDDELNKAMLRLEALLDTVEKNGLHMAPERRPMPLGAPLGAQLQRDCGVCGAVLKQPPQRAPLSAHDLERAKLPPHLHARFDNLVHAVTHLEALCSDLEQHGGFETGGWVGDILDKLTGFFQKPVDENAMVEAAIVKTIFKDLEKYKDYNIVKTSGCTLANLKTYKTDIEKEIEKANSDCETAISTARKNRDNALKPMQSDLKILKENIKNLVQHLKMASKTSSKSSVPVPPPSEAVPPPK